MNSYSDVILSTLSDKVGDNLQKVKERAGDALISAASHQLFGVKQVLIHLCSDTPSVAPTKGGKKPVITSKTLKSKYEVLHRIIASYNLTND